jgi:hypothetical protein
MDIGQVVLQLLVTTAFEGAHITGVHYLSTAQLYLMVAHQMLENVEGLFLNF